MTEPEQMAQTSQRDDTNPDETTLSAFSEYSNKFLGVLGEQTEGQPLSRERKKWPAVLVTILITLPTAVEGISPHTTELVYTCTHPTQQEEL